MRYFKLKNTFLPIIITALLIASVFMPVRTVYAAGSISLTSENAEGVTVGSLITVAYEAVAEGDAEAPQIAVTYDPNRLQLTQADKEYTDDGSGNLLFTELTASISFSVLSGGEAVISASAYFGGDDSDMPSSSLSIMVEGEDTAAAMTAAADASYSDMGVAAQTIASPDGAYLVSTVFPDEYLPQNFHKSTTIYQGTDTECAVFDAGGIELLYTTDQSGQSGSFKSFDDSAGELSAFRQIVGPSGKSIIIIKAPEDAQTPDGYTKVTLQWNGENLEAYTEMGDSGEVLNPDFFVVYAMNSDGNTGWYTYDQVEGTYQRFVTEGNASAENESDEGLLLGIPLTGWIIIGILGLLALIFLVIMIITLIKLKDFESYEYIDEDEGDLSKVPDMSDKTAKKAAANDGGALPSGDPGKASEIAAEAEDTLKEISDEELFDPRSEKKERKAREKAEKKEKKAHRKGKEEAQGSFDFEAMESAMKREDSRRPRGMDNKYPNNDETKIPEEMPEDNGSRSVEAEAGTGVEPEKLPKSGKPIGASQPYEEKAAGSAVKANEIKKSESPVSGKGVKKPVIPEGKRADKNAERTEIPAQQKGTGKQAKREGMKPLETGAAPMGALAASVINDGTKIKKPAPKPPAGMDTEELRRQELLNAAKKPELKPAQAPAYQNEPRYYSDGYNAQQYQNDYAPSGYPGQQMQYAQDAQYQGYGNGQYEQQGYMDYQYQNQYYGQNDQYGGYYEPVPGAPQYNIGQYGNTGYDMQYDTSYGQQYEQPQYQNQNQGMGYNGQQGQNYDNIDIDEDDDFEFEFINTGDK
ncbi:MAG: hypothetical protein K5770_15610 [Lachnospiraceae bacterium]|nr:hypothetical protein [Lachnospiraceae bacterium]